MRKAMRALRNEQGVNVIELVFMAAILLLVLSTVLSALEQITKHEKSAREQDQAVGEARSALDQLSREIRQADGLQAGTNGVEAVAWYDANGDGVEALDEHVSYDLQSNGTGQRLVRTSQAGTHVLVAKLKPSSTVNVVPANDGVLLKVDLKVDAGSARPDPVDIETGVLARNA